MPHRIGTELSAPAAAAGLLLLGIAVGSACYIRDVQETTAGMLAETVANIRAAKDLEVSVREVRSQGERYLLSGDPNLLEPIPRLRERTMAALGHVESLVRTPAERSLVRRTRAGLRTFFTECDRMARDHPGQADYARTRSLVDAVLAPEVIDPAREYLRLREGMLARADVENRRAGTRLTAGLVTVGLSGGVGGLLGGWALSPVFHRIVVRALGRLRPTARRLSAAACTVEGTSDRAHRSADALDDAARGTTAVLARLRQAEQVATQVEHLAGLGRISGGLAHEVARFLSAIRRLLRPQEDGRTGAGVSPQDAQVLDAEIVRLEQFVGSLLDFARPGRPARPSEAGSGRG